MKKILITLVLMFIVLEPEGILADKFRPPSQWKLFEYGDQSNPLYINDSTSEFLALCTTESGNDAETCLEVNMDKMCINDCSAQRLKALIFAKEKVRGLVDHMSHPVKGSIVWLILILCCVGGIYLNLKGHFQWVNIPLIGNWLVDDPTNGIKFHHYIWMKWIILGNSNIHWRTYMKHDCFVYNWTPLTNLPWDRPPTPKEERQNELSDRAPWTMEDILIEKGIGSIDTETNGALDGGWEKVVRASLAETMSENNTEPNEGSVYQDVLDEYWERIYVWSWHRYRNIPEDYVKVGSFGKEVLDDEDE